MEPPSQEEYLRSTECPGEWIRIFCCGRRKEREGKEVNETVVSVFLFEGVVGG